MTSRTTLIGQIQQPGRPPADATFVVESTEELAQSFTDADATPSVVTTAQNKLFLTANTGATTITDFDDGRVGQVIWVVINDANTTIDFTASGLKGNGGANWSPTTGDHMTCIYDGTDWYCDVSDNTA